MAHILVVDDDPDFVEITRMVLEDNDHVVYSASDGKEALSVMHQNKPDLILLDIMMADILDGLVVTQKMQDDPDLSGIPIIVVSAIAGSQYAGQFPVDEYLHVDNWINKPIQPDVLLEKVKFHLDRSAMEG